MRKYVCEIPNAFFFRSVTYIDFGEEINSAKWYFILSMPLPAYARALTQRSLNKLNPIFSICSCTCSLCVQFIHTNEFNAVREIRNFIVATWLVYILQSTQYRIKAYINVVKNASCGLWMVIDSVSLLINTFFIHSRVQEYASERARRIKLCVSAKMDSKQTACSGEKK